jgi:hypothetical protein
MSIPYRIHKINRPRRSPQDIAAPATCTLHGILKVDQPESPHLVYNEYVALRLGQALRVPVADGILAVAGDGLAYVGLESGLPGMDLPDVRSSQLAKVAERHPSAAAALVAFDIWIGNRHRGCNVKASLLTPHSAMFRAFDHGRALLDAGDDVDSSIRALQNGNLIVETHPFYRRVDDDALRDWTGRIAAVDGNVVRDCCDFRHPFRTVSVDTQEKLQIALRERALKLEKIIAAHADLILQ